MAMHIDFAQLTRILPHVIKARKPVLIRGKHGIGKSEVVYQLAPKRNPRVAASASWSKSVTRFPFFASGRSPR